MIGNCGKTKPSSSLLPRRPPENISTCPGIGDLGSAIIATRAYLEPPTKTRPLDTELVLDQAIHIKP